VEDQRTREGLLAGVSAYALWGLFPLFFALLSPASALEILGHRIVWSLLVVVLVLLVTRSWEQVRAVPRPQVLRLAVAAVLLAANWGVYVYAVNSHQVVQASLGYFVNPLLTVALGVVVLGERLRGPQQVAVGIAAVAVAVLTVDAGTLPWVALVLAATFGTYGLLKKQADVGAVASLAVETMVLAPVALGYLLLAGGTFTSHGGGHAALLASSGVVTAVPLLLFGAAATRIPLSTLGTLQYLTPTGQLLVALLVRHEPFGAGRALGFALVWAALAVFTTDLVRHHRRLPSVASC
jgi:chloramphenicol-sensitive protein RarD